jgi:hypothetical protein
MPDATSESGLQGRMVRAIKKEWPNAWLFHPVGHPYQTSGIPDLLMCIDGMFVGIEVKWARPGESTEHALSRVTHQQQHNIDKINEAGGVAGATTTVEGALDLCRRAVTNKREGSKNGA